jgi:urease accessory protein
LNAVPAASLAPELSGARLDGHLRLVCDLDARGQCRLREQSFSAPVHLSKPHYHEETLILNVANPTAGFFAGDRLRVDVRVETGARLLLTAPSANRVHTMAAGHAEVRQRLRVAAGASLEVWPELLIPQRGARYHQRTTIELEPGAELLFFERLAPGRTAMGETFAFTELRLELDVRRMHGRLLLRERSHLAPGSPVLEALTRRFPGAYYASAVLCSPGLTAAATCWRALHDQQNDETWIGVSALEDGVFVLRMVAADSLALRRTLNMVRDTVYRALGREVPGLRRT